MAGRLTKAQIKSRDRIQAWLKDEPFKENSRSKPAVPVLDTQKVMSEYVVPDPSRLGQFFTPLEIAKRVWLVIQENLYWQKVSRVLDPCAGIGNLLYPAWDMRGTYGWPVEDFYLEAWELQIEAYTVGAKLLPDIAWHYRDGLDYKPLSEDRFDLVIMNPPFGLRYTSEKEYLDKRSEYKFLEMALHLLAPNSDIFILAPSTYFSSMPSKLLKAYPVIEKMTRIERLGGGFLQTNIQVDLFHLFVPRLESDLRKADYYDPRYGLSVRSDVAAAFSNIELPPSKQEAYRILRTQRYLPAAEFVRSLSNIQYGNLFYYGWIEHA